MILRLTLTRKRFDEIATGKKKHEYRIAKPYWTKRLQCGAPILGFHPFKEVWFRNGYSPDAPFMRVEFKGISAGFGGPTLPEGFRDQVIYDIALGDVLEIQNWPAPERPLPGGSDAG